MRNRRGGKARCCVSASRCCVIGCQRQLYVDNAVAAITNYPSFPPRDYLPVCICSTFTRWKISNIAQRLASRAQVVRESTFLVAFRRLPSKNREFSTVVRRFSYSVWKGRRPASNGRVAFRARVVQCALVSHALGGFALKRFLCFRISSNTFRFDERKCFYFGGRNVKRVSRRSFNFFYVSLGKKRKQREKRKEHFPLPRAYRILKISKRNNTKMLLGRDNPSPLRSREIRGEQSIRQIFGSTARSGRTNTGQRKYPRPLSAPERKHRRRKSFGSNRPSMHIHYAATFHPRDTPVSTIMHRRHLRRVHALSPLPSSTHPGYPVAARVCASHGPACTYATRASTVQTLRADCYSGASPVFSRTQPSD